MQWTQTVIGMHTFCPPLSHFQLHRAPGEIQPDLIEKKYTAYPDQKPRSSLARCLP